LHISTIHLCLIVVQLPSRSQPPYFECDQKVVLSILCRAAVVVRLVQSWCFFRWHQRTANKACSVAVVKCFVELVRELLLEWIEPGFRSIVLLHAFRCLGECDICLLLRFPAATSKFSFRLPSHVACGLTSSCLLFLVTI
jgi:hypothetical protein